MPFAHTCFQAPQVPKQVGDLESAAFHLYLSQPADVKIGRPILVEVTAVNVTDQPQPVEFNSTVFTLYMQKDGKSIRHSAKQRRIIGDIEPNEEPPLYSGPIVTAPVQPAAPITWKLDLDQYFVLAESGTYQLCAEFFQARSAVTRSITLTKSEGK